MNRTIRGAVRWENEGKMQEELKCHLKREEGGKRGRQLKEEEAAVEEQSDSTSKTEGYVKQLLNCRTNYRAMSTIKEQEACEKG